VRYCCVAWGRATAVLRPELAGTQMVRVAYRAACSAHHQVVLPGGRAVPLSELTRVTERCPLALEGPLKLKLEVLGGLHCCGRTQIQSIELVPTLRRWSRQRCALLWKGIEAAYRMGPKRAAAFIRAVIADDEAVPAPAPQALVDGPIMQ
jgi:hypothetical protein